VPPARPDIGGSEAGRGPGPRLVHGLLEHPEVAGTHHTALFASPDVAPFHEGLGFAPQTGSYLRR